MEIKAFFARVYSMSICRMWHHVCLIHQDSGINRFWILCDMIWCALHYGIGYLEYQVFGFAYIRGAKRKTFMTMNDNLKLVRAVNAPVYQELFEDKIRFNERFQNYLGREWIDLRKAGEKGFADFIDGREFVFAKAIDDFGGIGISRIAVKECTDIAGLYHGLMEQKRFLVEEQIRQDARMNRLCPSSINTVRMVTALAGGTVHLVYSLSRMADGTKSVDNISSGGIYCPVNEQGMINKPGFCDKTGVYYEEHPYTKTPLVGFEIPRFQEAVELVKRAACEVPQVRYVGWDVAISESGPVLVEGNTIPGYDMCQNYYHLQQDKTGILPKFQKYFPEVLGKS